MDQVSFSVPTLLYMLLPERFSIKWGKSFLNTLATMKIQREEPRRDHPENLNKNAEAEKAIEAGSDVVAEYKDSSLTNGH